MTNRTANIAAFLDAAGWADAQRSSLAGDASNRRYERVRRPTGERAVLMDAPPDKGEDVRPFVSIANHLNAVGLSAPKVLFSDPDKGFLLIEDLGDALFARYIQADPAAERPLYEAAIDVLVDLHAAQPPDLDTFDADVSVPLAALAFDWYQTGALGHVDRVAKERFSEAMDALIRPLDTEAKVVIQRDYHAENLIWLPDREGVARVGLLDFQDAMLGHPAYDLVSILQDARRDVSARLEQDMIARFLAQTAHPTDAFRTSYAIFGAQRNLRILGVFARLCLRDGKAHYIDLIPRVWGHIQTNLRHPALSDLTQIVDASLPPPSPEVLTRLRRQCATHPTP